MTVEVDPARVVVIAIGLESYRFGDGVSLPGVGAEAARFAQWAIDCGVPAAQVWLACSWRDGTGQVPDGVRVCDTTQGALVDLFAEASELTGDQLLLFWCGHGVLNEGRQRALYTSDAFAKAARVFVVDELHNYLASDAFPGFDQQVLFIDACANFARDMRITDDLTKGPLHPGAPRQVTQQTLFAASQGEFAENDPIRRETGFSRALLDWLEAHPSLPLDFGGVVAHVDQSFEELSTRGMPRQHPVTRVVQSMQGAWDQKDYGGGMPVSGQTQGALASSGVSVRQLLLIQKEIYRRVPISEEDLRQELFTAAGAPGQDDDRENTLLLAQVVAQERSHALLQALSSRAGTPAQRSDLAELRSVWRRQRVIAPFLSAFEAVTLDHMRAAFCRAVPEVTSRMPVDLDEAMDQAATFSSRIEFEPFFRFVAALEQLTGTRLPEHMFAGYLTSADLSRIRDDLEPPVEAPARIVLEVLAGGGPPSSFEWPAELVVHVHVPGGGWQPPRVVSCGGGLEGVRATATEEILRMAKDHRLFSIGFLLPRAAFYAVPEMWTTAPSPLAPERPVWEDRPTTLHVAERRQHQGAVEAWDAAVERITKSLRHANPTFDWIGNGVDFFAIKDRVEASSAQCQGFEFGLDESPADLAGDPLIASVLGGAPYVFWAIDPPGDWQETKTQLQALVEGGAFKDIPVRLRDLRKRDREGLGKNLRLVWDDPDALPPIPELIGMIGAEP